MHTCDNCSKKVTKIHYLNDSFGVDILGFCTECHVRTNVVFNYLIKNKLNIDETILDIFMEYNVTLTYEEVKEISKKLSVGDMVV